MDASSGTDRNVLAVAAANCGMVDAPRAREGDRPAHSSTNGATSTEIGGDSRGVAVPFTDARPSCPIRLVFARSPKGVHETLEADRRLLLAKDQAGGRGMGV